MAAANYKDFDNSDFERFATSDKFIETGAYGQVYGPIEWRNEICAMKRIFFNDFTDDSKEKIEKTRAIWMSLNHKNLIKIHFVSLKLPTMYIVMEHAAGRSLRYTLNEIVKNDPSFNLPIEVVSDWAMQIAEGMAYLHTNNIVHRDLKSTNVMLMTPFEVSNARSKITLKITDFDEMREHQQTQTFSLKGTIAWMAPEVFKNQRFSKASDVWSFGVVLWEILTKELPHKDLTQGRLTQKALSGDLALTTTELIPEEFRELLQNCFKQKQEERILFNDVLSKLNELTEDTETCAVLVGISNGLSINNEVLKINLHQSNEISYLKEIPTKMCIEAAAAVYGNAIYVVGIGTNCKEIWKYSIIAGWRKCAKLVQRRQRHCIAFLNEVLYICGGILENSGIKRLLGKTMLRSVEAFNTKLDTCTTVGKLVHSVMSSGNCVPFHHSLYIFGGIDKEKKWVHYVQVYDTTHNTCSLLSKPMPSIYCQMKAALWKTSVILIGFDNCLIFDFESQAWKERKQYKSGVDHFGLILEYDRVFIIGGGVDDKDGEGKVTWKCRDDVKYVSVKDILENNVVEWKIHAKLPNPSLIYAFEIKYNFHSVPNYNQIEKNAIVQRDSVIRIKANSIDVLQQIDQSHDDEDDVFAEERSMYLEEFNESLAREDGLSDRNALSNLLERDHPAIYGLASLDDEVFISRLQHSWVEVYDSETFTFKRRFEVDGMSNPEHIVSCSINKCLYAFDWSYKRGPCQILRINPNDGGLINSWETEIGGGRLSVANDTNIILNVNWISILIEYTNDGYIVRIISLDSGTEILRSWHALKLRNDQFVVCHGRHGDPQRRVCLLRVEDEPDEDDISNTQLIKAFGGEEGSTLENLSEPAYLATNNEESIVLSDFGKRRAVLLNSSLENSALLTSSAENGTGFPFRVCFDELRGRWLVADYDRVSAIMFVNGALLKTETYFLSHKNYVKQVEATG